VAPAVAPAVAEVIYRKLVRTLQQSHGASFPPAWGRDGTGRALHDASMICATRPEQGTSSSSSSGALLRQRGGHHVASTVDHHAAAGVQLGNCASGSRARSSFP
jgi:hypothetical protein